MCNDWKSNLTDGVNIQDSRNYLQVSQSFGPIAALFNIIPKDDFRPLFTILLNWLLKSTALRCLTITTKSLPNSFFLQSNHKPSGTFMKVLGNVPNINISIINHYNSHQLVNWLSEEDSCGGANDNNFDEDTEFQLLNDYSSYPSRIVKFTWKALNNQDNRKGSKRWHYLLDIALKNSIQSTQDQFNHFEIISRSIGIR
ncbi:hypothetical protein ACTA71_007047 [Dictyostelium dimigraforme]